MDKARLGLGLEGVFNAEVTNLKREIKDRFVLPMTAEVAFYSREELNYKLPISIKIEDIDYSVQSITTHNLNDYYMYTIKAEQDFY